MWSAIIMSEKLESKSEYFLWLERYL